MLPTNGVAARVSRLKSTYMCEGTNGKEINDFCIVLNQKRDRLQDEALANLDYEQSIPFSDVKGIFKQAW